MAASRFAMYCAVFFAQYRCTRSVTSPTDRLGNTLANLDTQSLVVTTRLGSSITTPLGRTPGCGEKLCSDARR
jgi:hypothetical protein